MLKKTTTKDMRSNNMFSDENEYQDMCNLLDEWTNGPQHIKNAFIKFKDNLLKKENITVNFISRPGITYSLRATVKENPQVDKPLFAMMDIIDDDPENRWLSICFFGEMISDPEDNGDFVPGGLLGADACCFDFEEDDNSVFQYIQQRIDEAYAYMSPKTTKS